MATTKSTAKAKEFPAKAGEPEVEVEERSVDGSDGLRHVKEFVVLAPSWPEDMSHPANTANAAAVANEAIQRGLHPRGEVRLDGTEEHRDGVSLTVRYSVQVVPSSIDDQPQNTTTPRNVLTGDSEG